MILVVDDHADTRFLMIKLLQLEGYDATAVASGSEALAFLDQHVPLLVLLDYHMPDMNGAMVFQEMKKDARLDKVPAILFSANDDEAKDHAREVGIDAFVAKSSLDWEKLLREIVRFAGPAPRPSSLPKMQKDANKDLG